MAAAKVSNTEYGYTMVGYLLPQTNACCAAGRPHNLIVEALRAVPAEVKDKFYGCGAPLPLGIEGLRVLDLGSGSGRDCFVAAKLVGAQG